MNKKEFVEGLERMGMDKAEFIILSGGSLLIRGLREQTNDYDISATKKLAKDIDMYSSPLNSAGSYEPFENVEMKDDYEKHHFDIVDGYKCESLEDILEFKRIMRRPKDLKDIETIEKYLNSK